MATVTLYYDCLSPFSFFAYTVLSRCAALRCSVAPPCTRLRCALSSEAPRAGTWARSGRRSSSSSPASSAAWSPPRATRPPARAHGPLPPPRSARILHSWALRLLRRRRLTRGLRRAVRGIVAKAAAMRLLDCTASRSVTLRRLSKFSKSVLAACKTH